MKKLLFLVLTAALFIGCSDDDEPCNSKLIDASSFIQVTANNKPFDGYLEMFPCNGVNYTYYGNYQNNELTPFYAAYLIAGGSIHTSIRPLILPVGKYDLLYWGVSNPEDTTLYQESVRSPALSVGKDLISESWTLVPYSYGDTLYHPVYDFSHVAKQVSIGTENIAVPLQRAVSAILVTLNAAPGQTFDSSIDTIFAYVGNIANELNFCTAAPSDFTKTIRFPLTIAADRKSAKSYITMVFPSAPDPLFTIRIFLKNGEEKKFSKPLSNQLVANNRLSLLLEGNVIFSETTSSSGFEVNHWTESNEEIDLPPLQ